MAMQYGFKVRFSEHIIEDNIGQLICTDVVLARDGAYEYMSDDVFNDGKFNIIELHRDWEDVRKLKFTLEGKPVVYYHPDKSVDIDINNIDEFRIGHAQNIREGKAEGYNVLIGDLFITDSETKELVKSGKLREVSLGYFYDVDDSDKNHLKQVNMIGEHVAIVHQGRAGIAKIRDAADTYVLARIRPNGELGYVQYQDDKPAVGAHKWFNLQKYGYYRFNVYIEFDQASPITLRTIGFIVKENPTNSFIVLNTNQQIVKAYYHGKKIEVIDLESKGFNLNKLNSANIDLDPYDIPDEITATTEPTVSTERDIKSLGLELEPLLKQADKDFRHFGDNYRGTAWLEFAKLLKKNKNIAEVVLKTKLPADIYNGEYLHLAESFVRYAKGYNKKAGDEVTLNLLVVLFDKEKSDLRIVFTLDDLKATLKQYSKKMPSFEKVEDLVFELNLITGVYAVNIYDFSSKLFVSKAINDDEVEVYICEDVNEINKALTEYFRDLDEAHLKINSSEEKYSTMSALRI